jgi:hypothetical protein
LAFPVSLSQLAGETLQQRESHGRQEETDIIFKERQRAILGIENEAWEAADKLVQVLSGWLDV